jgi:hypothetical protein
MVTVMPIIWRAIEFDLTTLANELNRLLADLLPGSRRKHFEENPV